MPVMNSPASQRRARFPPMSAENSEVFDFVDQRWIQQIAAEERQQDINLEVRLARSAMAHRDIWSG